jgi:hypothetical protein
MCFQADAAGLRVFCFKGQASLVKTDKNKREISINSRHGVGVGGLGEGGGGVAVLRSTCEAARREEVCNFNAAWLR